MSGYLGIRRRLLAQRQREPKDGQAQAARTSEQTVPELHKLAQALILPVQCGTPASRSTKEPPGARSERSRQASSRPSSACRSSPCPVPLGPAAMCSLPVPRLRIVPALIRWTGQPALELRPDVVQALVGLGASGGGRAYCPGIRTSLCRTCRAPDPNPARYKTAMCTCAIAGQCHAERTPARRHIRAWRLDGNQGAFTAGRLVKVAREP